MFETLSECFEALYAQPRQNRPSRKTIERHEVLTMMLVKANQLSQEVEDFGPGAVYKYMDGLIELLDAGLITVKDVRKNIEILSAAIDLAMSPVWNELCVDNPFRDLADDKCQKWLRTERG